MELTGKPPACGSNQTICRLRFSRRGSNTSTALRPPGRMTAFRAMCKQCLHYCRPPPWMVRLSFLVYTNCGGVFTYVLLLLVLYTTSFALRQSVALLPICRHIAEPLLYADTDSSNQSAQSTSEPNQSLAVPPGYRLALECRRGEAISILIFYGLGFVFGELMELLHLPGLLGMLLGGLFLRNIGEILIPERVYHEGNLPKGSYPLQANFTSRTSEIPDSQFNIRDTWTQLAALLVVNPSLSGIMRQLALTTILSRAGLGLDPAILKQVCGSVFRLAFIPCICEALTLMIVTRFLIGWPWVWGAILGFVCAAVSPAVIVPNMMRLEVTGWGVAEGIPTLVVAAASLDDVISITGFGVALAVGLSTGESLVATLFWGPVEALLGAAFGASVGLLLCFFPPPKLEHSHILRGILLMCLAVTGLLGSIALHLPGAGALACLTLAFVVATGWRAGLPWRLTQSEELSGADEMSTMGESNTGTNANVNQGPLTLGDAINQKPPGNSAEPDPSWSDQEKTTDTDMSHKAEAGQLDELGSVDQTNRPTRRQHNDSITSGILETLVEYHPYYCSILRQQYQHPSGKNFSPRSSILSNASKKAKKNISGADLPSIAVAVAAAGIERRDGHNNPSVPMALSRTRSRASRRFSLPEPTAHYELESFSVQQGVSASSARSSGRSFTQQRRRVLSPPFREQYAGIYNQPVDKLEGIEELDYDPADGKAKRSEVQGPLEPPDRNINAMGSGGWDGVSTHRPATPKERGLACVNSMRQMMAAIWWFVQPLLFSLIGSEVNLAVLAGQSIGHGVASLLIAVVMRIGATVLAVLPSKMNMKERLFVGFAWLPKATVQAAVGPVALDTARKLHAPPEIIHYSEQVLTLAALAILLTAPLGAILMPLTAPYLLRQDLSASQVMVARTTRPITARAEPVPVSMTSPANLETPPNVTQTTVNTEP
ncbi:unnamed protein product [Dicrocoelium dendriticum]|nr:unnamed protein product [Dicrocoelium dendriticum]